jgi:hypothetical protein
MLYDNPAARLKAILETGKRHPGGHRCLDVWCVALGVRPDQTSEFFERLGKVMELPNKTRRLIKTYYPHQIESSEACLSKIDSAFQSQSLNGTWGTFANQIDEHAMSVLGFMADMLHSKVSAIVVSQDELEQIFNSFKELLDVVDASNISNSLKQYFANEINDLLNAIRDYKISGAVPILKQAESMAGHVLLDPEYASFLKDHELGKRVLDNLNAMAAVLSVAVSLPQLANFSKLLLN